MVQACGLPYLLPPENLIKYFFLQPLCFFERLRFKADWIHELYYRGIYLYFAHSFSIYFCFAYQHLKGTYLAQFMAYITLSSTFFTRGTGLRTSSLVTRFYSLISALGNLHSLLGTIVINERKFDFKSKYLLSVLRGFFWSDDFDRNFAQTRQGKRCKIIMKIFQFLRLRKSNFICGAD